jgi:hypothetical protein
MVAAFDGRQPRDFSSGQHHATRPWAHAMGTT